MSSVLMDCSSASEEMREALNEVVDAGLSAAGLPALPKCHMDWSWNKGAIFVTQKPH